MSFYSSPEQALILAFTNDARNYSKVVLDEPTVSGCKAQQPMSRNDWAVQNKKVITLLIDNLSNEDFALLAVSEAPPNQKPLLLSRCASMLASVLSQNPSIRKSLREDKVKLRNIFISIVSPNLSQGMTIKGNDIYGICAPQTQRNQKREVKAVVSDWQQRVRLDALTIIEQQKHWFRQRA